MKKPATVHATGSLAAAQDYQRDTEETQDTNLDRWPGKFVKLGKRSKAPISGQKRIETPDHQVAAGWMVDGFNVGLVPGDGLIVVDVDPRNDGHKTIKQLKQAHGLPKTLMTATGGDGVHAFYIWPENAGKPRGTLGQGIDIKHGLNAHVVAPGSVHPETGKVYRWANDAGITTAPEWMVARLTNRPALAALPGNAPDLGLTNVDAHGLDDTPENRQRVDSALAVLDAGCDYSTWRDTVWAVLATGWPDAKAIARAWSQSVPVRFDSGAFDSLVAGFKHDGGITVGTLFHWAAQAGWQDPHKASQASDGSGDLLNARLLAARLRDKLVFVPEVNHWLRFDDSAGWLRAEYGREVQAAKGLADELRIEAAELWKAEPDSPRTKKAKAHAERANTAKALTDMISLAKTEPGMAVPLNDWDADPWLLGVTNGVLNLRTRQLLQPNPSQRISKRAGVAFDAAAVCPQFERFMAQIHPDTEVRAFIQRWAGYCLTGETSAQAFVFAFGVGRNGKSVLVELLAWLLGDYARKIPTGLLMAGERDPNAPAPEIVSLKGVRFAYASETEEGSRLAAARLKELTGGDTLHGRVPYASQAVTFLPSHKLMITGNHKPEIRDDSFGMWRRVLLVPFGVTIPENEVDAALPEKLRGEGAGILNWCLRGLVDYRRRGLNPPEAIHAAVSAYKDEQDILGEWLSEHTERGAAFIVDKQDLYRAHKNWCLANGHGVLSASKLSRRLKDRGVRVTADKRGYQGLKLSPEGVLATRFF